MFGNGNGAPVIEAVDLLRTELREINAGRLLFRIMHRFHPAGADDCVPGEEVFAIVLVYRGREHQLRLSPALLLLGDYLLRHSRYAQTATQIATGIHESGFHGRSAPAGQRRHRIPRSAIKEYTKRLRRAIALVLVEAQLRIDPRDILLAKESVSNHVLYQWRAAVEVVHIYSTAKDSPIWD